MAQTKRRSPNDITGTIGENIAESKFPSNWVVRKLPRDYGLDFDVEVFSPVAGTNLVQTKGQHLWVQVKSTTDPDEVKLVRGHPTIALDDIEMPLIETVISMGVAVPVLLVRVNTLTQTAHWMCLTDYIDKVLRPSNPTFRAQKSTTVYFNPDSVLDSESDSFWLIEALSQRAKLVGAFYLTGHFCRAAGDWLSKWETTALLNGGHIDPESMRRESGMFGLGHLIDEIEQMDIWAETDFGGNVIWAPLPKFHAVLIALREAIEAFGLGNDNPNAVLLAGEASFVNEHNLPVKVSDMFAAKGAALVDFFANFRSAISSIESIADGYDNGHRWKGLAFPQPLSSEQARNIWGQ